MPDYDSFDGLYNHLKTQAANIERNQTVVGADDDDVNSIFNDKEAMRAVGEYFVLLKNAYKTAARLKRNLTRGSENASLGKLAALPAPPDIPLQAGIRQRSMKRDRRFARSKNITAAALAALDLKSTKTYLSPDDVQPQIKVVARATDYQFEITVTERGKADMFEVEGRRMNSETWENLKNATGKSVLVKVAPSIPGQVERLEIRVRLFRKNQPYGNHSSIVYVNINP